MTALFGCHSTRPGPISSWTEIRSNSFPDFAMITTFDFSKLDQVRVELPSWEGGAVNSAALGCVYLRASEAPAVVKSFEGSHVAGRRQMRPTRSTKSLCV